MTFGAAGVELGPVGEVLGGVVGAVVASPPGVAFEVAALVEVAVVELLGGSRLRVDQQALQQCPSRRRHGGIDDYIGVAGVQVQLSGLHSECGAGFRACRAARHLNTVWPSTTGGRVGVV